MKYRSLLALAALLLLPLFAGAAERLIIDHVTVIEGTGRAPQPDMACHHRRRSDRCSHTEPTRGQ
jgi:hypothetical protein